MSLFSMNNIQKTVDGAQKSEFVNLMFQDPFGIQRQTTRNQQQTKTIARSGRSQIWRPSTSETEQRISSNRRQTNRKPMNWTVSRFK